MTGVLTTALKQLVRAGMTGDELVAAFGEIERDLFATMQLLSAPVASKDDAAEKRRTYDRERKRAKAAEERERKNSTGIPAESVEVPQNIGNSGGSAEADPSLPLPPNDNISNPLTPTHPDNTPRAKGPWDCHVSAWLEWREKNPFPKPWWAEPNVWRDLKANRKAKRLPNTITAHTKFLRDIAALVTPEWPPGRLLETIVARGWVAAYDPRPKGANNDRSDRTRNSSRYEPDGAMAYLQGQLGIGADNEPARPADRWDDGSASGGNLLPYSRD